MMILHSSLLVVMRRSTVAREILVEEKWVNKARV